MNFANKWTKIIFGLTLGYALLRYVILGPVEAIHIPVYILNKSFAYTGLALIGISLTLRPLADLFPNLKPYVKSRREFGLNGLGFSLLHSVLTLVILNPSYFGKFFAESGKLNFHGELIVLTGVLSLMIFLALGITSFKPVIDTLKRGTWKAIHSKGVWALTLVAGHIITMGYGGWLKPEGWHGGLPPITLWSIVTIALVFSVRGLAVLVPMLPPLDFTILKARGLRVFAVLIGFGLLMGKMFRP